MDARGHTCILSYTTKKAQPTCWMAQNIILNDTEIMSVNHSNDAIETIFYLETQSFTPKLTWI